MSVEDSKVTSYGVDLPFMDSKTIFESVHENDVQKARFLSKNTDIVNAKIGCPIDRFIGLSYVSGEVFDVHRAHRNQLLDSMEFDAIDAWDYSGYNDNNQTHDLINKIRLERGWIIILICDLPNGLIAGSRYEIGDVHPDFILCRSIDGVHVNMWHCIRRVTIGGRTQFPVCIDLTANIIEFHRPLCLSQEQYDSFIAYDEWRYNGKQEIFVNYNHVQVAGYVAGTKDHLAVIYLNRFKFIPNMETYYLLTVKMGCSA